MKFRDFNEIPPFHDFLHFLTLGRPGGVPGRWKGETEEGWQDGRMDGRMGGSEEDSEVGRLGRMGTMGRMEVGMGGSADGRRRVRMGG